MDEAIETTEAVSLRLGSGELSALYLEMVGRKRIRQRVVCSCACGREVRIALDRWQNKPPKKCGSCTRRD